MLNLENDLRLRSQFREEMRRLIGQSVELRLKNLPKSKVFPTKLTLVDDLKNKFVNDFDIIRLGFILVIVQILIVTKYSFFNTLN